MILKNILAFDNVDRAIFMANAKNEGANPKEVLEQMIKHDEEKNRVAPRDKLFFTCNPWQVLEFTALGARYITQDEKNPDEAFLGFMHDLKDHWDNSRWIGSNENDTAFFYANLFAYAGFPVQKIIDNLQAVPTTLPPIGPRTEPFSKDEIAVKLSTLLLDPREVVRTMVTNNYTPAQIGTTLGDTLNEINLGVLYSQAVPNSKPSDIQSLVETGRIERKKGYVDGMSHSFGQKYDFWGRSMETVEDNMYILDANSENLAQKQFDKAYEKIRAATAETVKP